MLKVISTEKKPIKLWLNDLEEGALNQAKNLANLPFVFKHIAIMPDSHIGYGMPIGAILATQEVIIPNAVGVDIGCGMCVTKTSINVNDIAKGELKKIVKKIQELVPVGFNHQVKPQKMPDLNLEVELTIIDKEYEKAKYQIGTLGSGNHFIEIQTDSKGDIWIMIHSGSRNLGYKVAKYYNNLAKEMNKKWYVSIPSEWDMAFLPRDSKEAKFYINEMNYCIDFAVTNRTAMMNRVYDAFNDFVTVNQLSFINKPHNFAAIENHFGHNVIIHRKGATKAMQGELGMIPGSQGTKSYIVSGAGNKDSFKSCSHGAGRKLGRKAAKRELNLKNEIEKMKTLGVIHNIKTENDLDEAAGAYKDIDVVMKNQKDLVNIQVELIPLAVIKG